jgi:hypothetical protein
MSEVPAYVQHYAAYRRQQLLYESTESGRTVPHPDLLIEEGNISRRRRRRKRLEIRVDI